MMWDFGRGVYVPGDARPAPQVGYTHPPLDNYHLPSSPIEPSPFMPIGGPTPGFPAPGSISQTPSYSSSYSGSYPSPQMPSGGIPRGPTVVEVRHGHHHSRVHVTNGQVIRTHNNHIHRPTGTSAPQPPVQDQTGYFQYSKCTGKKKAVCIGINYFNTPEQLRGCINDAKNMRKFLIRYQNYKSEDIVLLTDDATDTRLLPTRQNILNAMHWLVYNAHSHDALFFHYSGHGNQVKDEDGDETDGYDEVIFPVDYKTNGYIVDDEMHRVMVKPLPVGCRLTGLFDSCHSGSALDLPYLYHTNGRVKESQVAPSHIAEKSTHADVISWSGCKDSQTSADTMEAGVATGAMSHAFIKTLKENPRQTYQQLLRSLRAILRDRYSQKPQLSSSHRIDTNLEFIM